VDGNSGNGGRSLSTGGFEDVAGAAEAAERGGKALGSVGSACASLRKKSAAINTTIATPATNPNLASLGMNQIQIG
jgi:hypothetical protein